MAGTTRRRGIIAEINVTPLVDIMLVLLIIFMLTANLMVRQAIEVELPRGSPASTLRPKALAITMKADGTIFLDDHAVTAEALRAAIVAAVATDDKTQVSIAGDKNVPYGRVAWVLDLVKSLKVTSFAMQIDPTTVVPPP